jgi:hypothetical protein
MQRLIASVKKIGVTDVESLQSRALVLSFVAGRCKRIINMIPRECYRRVNILGIGQYYSSDKVHKLVTHRNTNLWH